MVTARRSSARFRLLSSLLVLLSLLLAGTTPAAHRNMRLLRYFSVGLAPTGESMVIHEGRNKVYVATTSSVTVIDGAANERITTIPIPRQITRLALNERTDRLYVAIALFPRKEVHVIDTATDVPLGFFGVGGNPQVIAADSTRDLVLVGHRQTSTEPPRVDIYDGTSWSRLASVPMPQNTRRIVVDEAAGRVYALAQSVTSGSRPGSVVAIDADALVPLAEIAVGPQSRDMALAPLRGRLYVTNIGDDTLSVIDTVALGTLATRATGDGPWPVTVHVETGKVFVGNWFDRTVTAIDGDTLEISGTIPLDLRPEDLTAHPTERRVYVASGQLIHSIDPRQDRLAGTVAVPSAPEFLMVNGAADRLWAAGFDTFSIGDRSDGKYRPPVF